MIQIWHNHRCGKSRDAKKYLEEKGIAHEVFEYLKGEFSKDDLKNIISKLHISDARQMLRSKEKEYKDLDIDNVNKSQDEIIDLVVANPKLVERPIVINNDHAVIARPLEKIKEVL